MSRFLLGSIAVEPSWYCEPGKIIGFEGGQLVAMHPLDVLALEYRDRPLTRLDKAMALLLDRAHRKLDARARKSEGSGPSE